MLQIWKTFVPQVILADGTVMDAAAAEKNGLLLRQNVKENADGVWLSLELENRSGKTVALEKLNWHRSGQYGDFLNTPELLVYLEGWGTTSPCGVRRYDMRDFRYDPTYICFAAADPEDHSPAPGCFRAENMVMFHDQVSGNILLAGFVTSADQFGHFKMKMVKEGVDTLDIRSALDGRLLDDGETVKSETLLLLSGKDGFAVQQRYAGIWGGQMNARTAAEPPVGWCSWYYYFSNITEEDLIGNVKFISENRDRYPLKYIQLDEGYQSALGDWLVCNEKFPNGLDGVAKVVREHGFVPALWFGPFMVEYNSVLLKEHPEWMIHDKEGNVIFASMQWRGSKLAVLDGTHPEVQEHFRKLFRKVRELGFDYIKLDFMMLACTMRDGVLYDRKATRAQALRRGLQAIREGFGEDGFILGCTVPFGSIIGLVDGERVSTDITPYWEPDREYYDEAPTVPNVCRNVIRHAYMHKRLWNNDPDTLIVRDDNTKLTGNEVLLWFEIVRLIGGMLMLSDNFCTLSPERAKLPESLLRTRNNFETSPADFWNCHVPGILDAVDRMTGKKERWLFNFDPETAVIDGFSVPGHSAVQKM